MTTPSKDNQTRAVVVILFTVFTLAFGDALIKATSATFTLWQIFLLRSLVVVPVLFLVIDRFTVGPCVIPIQPFWTILRSVLLTLMWVSYYFSLSHIELSIAAAAYYTLPIFIMVFAAFFLSDTIAITGWLAVILGFSGVLAILAPGADDFNWYALLPLFSAILYALAMVLTRSKCREEHMFVLSLWLNVVMLITGVVMTWFVSNTFISSNLVSEQPFLFGQWSSIGVPEIIALIALSVTIITGSVGAAYAYQRGRPATIAVFDFAYVGFAMLWGVLFFSESLSVRALSGVILIVVAGCLAVLSTRD